MRRTGQALVIVGGETFVGHVDYDGRGVTVLGHLRRRVFIDGELEDLHGPEITRTWPIDRCEIRWQP